MNTTQKAWLLAATKGDTDIIIEMLKQGMPIDAGGETESGTALMRAASHGHLDIAILLLNHGADANLTDAGGMTALMWAVSSLHPDLVRYLVEHEADLNVRTHSGKNATDLAAEAVSFFAARLERARAIQATLESQNRK